MRLMRVAAAAAVGIGAMSCAPEGRDGSFGVTASGQVAGTVTFDADGSGAASVGDLPLSGVRVHVLLPVSRDTVASAETGLDGSFAVPDLPVGSYLVRVDSASLGDSLVISKGGAAALTIRPDDTLRVETQVTYPSLTTAEVRAAAVGTRVFVTGLALHARANFADTVLHVVDTSGYLRASRVRPTAVAAGDSIRLRGRIATREGQRVLDDVTVFTLGSGFLPAPATVTTAVLATGGTAGALDASLIRLVDVEVIDTVTVLGNLRVTVDDGSGPAVLILDRTADPAFRPPFLAGAWDAGRRYDVLGVVTPLPPSGWVLRPRNALDLTPR